MSFDHRTTLQSSYNGDSGELEKKNRVKRTVEVRR